jgi:hypothetical protein
MNIVRSKYLFASQQLPVTTEISQIVGLDAMCILVVYSKYASMH